MKSLTKLILIVCYFFSCLHVYAAPDTLIVARIKKLGDMAWENSKSNHKQTISYAQEGIALAKSIDDKNALADFYNTIGIGFKYVSKYDSAIFYYKQALEVFVDIEKTSGIVASYNNLGIVNTRLGNYNEAEKCYKKGLTLASEQGLTRYYSACLSNYSNLLLDKGRYEEALKLMKEASENKKFYETNKANFHGNLSNIYKNLGNYKLAIEHALNSIKYETDTFGLHQSYNILAGLYVDLKEWENAKLYCLKSHNYFKNINKHEAARALINLSIACRNLNNLDSAIYCLKQSEELISSFENIDLHPYISQEYGMIYLAQKDTLKSRPYLAKAADAFMSTGDSASMGKCYWVLAKTHQHNQPAKAMYYWEKIKDIPNTSKSLELQNEHALLGAELFYGRHEPEKAYRQLMLHKMLSDSLLNIETHNAINEIEAKYNSDLQKQKIEKLSALNQVKDQKIKVRRWQLAGSMAIMVLGAVASLMFFFFYKRKKQTEKLQAQIAGREKLRGFIAGELHDKVCSDLTGARLILQGIKPKESSIERHKGLNDFLKQIYSDTRNITHELKSSDWEKTDLEKLLANIIESTGLRNKDKVTMNIKENNGWDKFSFKKRHAIDRVLRELCTNIVKHSNAGETKISASRTGNQFEILLLQNGKIQHDKSNGIGQQSIEERIKSINGKICRENEENNTLKTQIRIPIN